MYVEKCSDDLWLGMKRLSNLAIAGSPRNIYWYSPDCKEMCEVEILGRTGARKGIHLYQTPNAHILIGSQYWRAIFWYERETTQIAG